jgi:hypothetical protein
MGVDVRENSTKNTGDHESDLAQIPTDYYGNFSIYCIFSLVMEFRLSLKHMMTCEHCAVVSLAWDALDIALAANIKVIDTQRVGRPCWLMCCATSGRSAGGGSVAGITGRDRRLLREVLKVGVARKVRRDAPLAGDRVPNRLPPRVSNEDVDREVNAQ